jgi:transposase InsO family protein
MAKILGSDAAGEDAIGVARAVRDVDVLLVRTMGAQHPDGRSPWSPKTLRRITTSYWFPSLTTWVRSLVTSCLAVKLSKAPPPRRTLGHSVPSEPIAEPFDTVAIDTSGPLPMSTKGNRYIVVVQDVFSRYVILTAVSTNTGTEVSRVLTERLVAEHGCPRAIMSDNGQPYAAYLVRRLCKHLSIDQRFAPLYHRNPMGW